MSYKRNSKSRIARLMLALTLMGSVGQRITNNVSAMNEGNNTLNISINSNSTPGMNDDVFLKQNYGVHKLGFDLENPVLNGQLTDDAKKFGRFLTCNPVLESDGVEIDGYGRFKRDKTYNVQSVKDSVMRSFASHYQKFVSEIDDEFGNTSFGAMYPAIAGIAKRGLFDFNFASFVDSKKSDDTFKLVLAMLGDPFKKKAEEIEGYRDFLKDFANGITGKQLAEGSKSALIVSSEGARLMRAGDVSSLSAEEQVIYSNAEFKECGDLENIDKDTSLEICQTLNSFIDEGQGNFILIGEEHYLVSNDAADDNEISLLATLAAINVYSNSGTVREALQKYQSIAKSPLKDKNKGLLSNSYVALQNLDEKSFPDEEKVGAITFVLNVKDAYSKNINQEVNKNDFLGTFNVACSNGDVFKKVVGMISSVFPTIFDTTQIMEHPAYGAFLKHVLVGGGVGGKANPGGKKEKKKGGGSDDRSDDGSDDGSDEKKGLSTGAKVAIGITIPAVVLTAAGVALWKTGYGTKFINKIKSFIGGSKVLRPDIKFEGSKTAAKN